MPRPPSSHGNWPVSLSTERRNKGTIANYDVTKRARPTTSESPRNTRVTPRERNRETHSLIKMNNVEYTCTHCDETSSQKEVISNIRPRTIWGQRWKCHSCDQYFVRRLDRTLHIVLVHPYEPRSATEKTDFVGGLRPPRKTCNTDKTVQEIRRK